MSAEVVGIWLNAFTPLLNAASGVIVAVVAGWAQARFSHKKSGA